MFKLKLLLTRYAGQVGYMYTNMKKAEEAQIGDTLHHAEHPVEPLPGFRPAKPMVSSLHLVLIKVLSRVVKLLQA